MLKITGTPSTCFAWSRKPWAAATCPRMSPLDCYWYDQVRFSELSIFGSWYCGGYFIFILSFGFSFWHESTPHLSSQKCPVVVFCVLLYSLFWTFRRSVSSFCLYALFCMRITTSEKFLTNLWHRQLSSVFIHLTDSPFGLHVYHLHWASTLGW